MSVDSTIALVSAVIQQWIWDGKPESGRAQVEQWGHVLEHLLLVKHQGGGQAI
jgi:hypothetical protein